MINIKQDLYPDKLLLDRKITPGQLPVEDNLVALEQHLKTQPSNWYYRTNQVVYKHNSDGYRCPEWSDIDWPSSWIIIGCSFVEGLGLDESDLLSTRLSELLAQPVINLGAGGTGPDAHLFNTIRLIDNGIRPKGVIYMNSEKFFTRFSLFTNEKAIPLGIWSLEKNRDGSEYSELYATWCKHPHHANTHSYLHSRSVVAMWESNQVPVHYFNIQKDLTPMFDLARDLKHPGRETVKVWARQIMSKLQTPS